MEKVTLTREEAETIVNHSLRKSSINLRFLPDGFYDKMVDGAKTFAESIQELGWTIQRPEK